MSGRLLVTGSRHFRDINVIRQALTSAREVFPTPPVLVHGAAVGADELCAQVWEGWGLVAEPHPAEWSLHGRRAGPLRNKEMVELGADLCMAFYVEGVNSAGTMHCTGLAMKAGIPVSRFWSGPLIAGGDE